MKTVADLIAMLSELDPSLPVSARHQNSMLWDLEDVKIDSGEPGTLFADLNFNQSWYP